MMEIRLGGHCSCRIPVMLAFTEPTLGGTDRRCVSSDLCELGRLRLSPKEVSVVIGTKVTPSRRRRSNTPVRDSNDRYANIEIGYLLQTGGMPCVR